MTAPQPVKKASNEKPKDKPKEKPKEKEEVKPKEPSVEEINEQMVCSQFKPSLSKNDQICKYPRCIICCFQDKILEEYLANNDQNEAVNAIKALKPPKKSLPVFVTNLIVKTLDRSGK